MKPILIIKTGDAVPPVRAKHGDFEDWFQAGLGTDCRVVDVKRGQALPADGFSAVVITGSPAMVTERRDWSESTRHWLAGQAARDGLPMLGVCYGHQLLADALGGEVADNPNGRQIGTIEVVLNDHHNDPLLGGLPERFQAQASHSQSVLQPPAGTQVLASSPRDVNHVIRFDEFVWGVQFHPEWNADITRGYLEVRREPISAEGQDVDALIAATIDPVPAVPVLGRFAQLVQHFSRAT